MIEKWIAVDDRVFAATFQEQGGRRLSMSVERLPGGGWDWTVWSSESNVRYGAAVSLDIAMTAAEQAAVRVSNRAPSSRSVYVQSRT
jgi:hypothetical protein